MLRKLFPVLIVVACWGMVQAADDPAESANLVNPILVGSPVPSAKLLDVEGKPVDLAEMVGQQPAILVFYRGGW